MNSLDWKKVLISGVVFAVLVVMVAVGVYLVRKPQSQSVTSKAAGCVGLWPADPGTSCGSSTQSPSQGASGTSLSPNFHWDYGGYRSGDTGCVQPSGCSTYSASVYLSEGSAGATAFARCDTATATSPVKDCVFSSFKLCNGDSSCHTDGMSNLSALKPNTTYYWKVTPFFDGVVHAEQTWIYSFTTGTGSQTVACNQTCDATHLCPSGLTCDTASGTCRNPACSTQTSCVCPTSAGACQRVTASKDLSTIKIGDEITFAGWGSVAVTQTPDSIDKINFRILKDGVEVTNQTIDAVLDPEKSLPGGSYYKAILKYKILSQGVYSVIIKVHQKNADIWKE